MSPPTQDDLQAFVTADYLTLAALLDELPDARWDTPSLCEGWRVREVVAHLTMPVRYPMDRFMAELRECDGDFTRLSNRVAARDSGLPTQRLVEDLRDETMHGWTPPGGGQLGALNHVVIHSLDMTVPLGVARCSTDQSLRVVLDDLTLGGTHAHFGFDLDGLRLRATDIDWSFGSGRPVTGPGEALALLICGRKLPPGRIDDEPDRRQAT